MPINARWNAAGLIHLPIDKNTMARRFCYLWAGTTLMVAVSGHAETPASHPASTATPGQTISTIQLKYEAQGYVPAAGFSHGEKRPLIILLHGAGQVPDQMISLFVSFADQTGSILLAPKSRGPTWDVVRSAEFAALTDSNKADGVFRYSGGKDADRVMSAINELAERVQIDPARQTLLGFSDGGSFALGLGTSRDRPFTKVIALSPGLAVVAVRPARNRQVIVAHGRQDRSLSFDFTRSRIVPALRAAKLIVKFVPFDGGHKITPLAFDLLNNANTD